jgi:hypothetical protein
MEHAPVYLPLTEANLLAVKRTLVNHFTGVKSSHLTEALAAALGRRTHAALLAHLESSDPESPEVARLDEAAFAARLAEVAGDLGRPIHAIDIFNRLNYPAETAILKTWSEGFDRVTYRTDRRRAWRNMMVAAINAGIERRLFGVARGDNHGLPARYATDDRREPPVYLFEVGGIPAIARAEDAHWGEVAVTVALWPTPDAGRRLGGNIAKEDQFITGDAYASGWLERKTAAYLMAGNGKLVFGCRRSRLATVAALDVQPLGFADRGTLR